VDPDLGQIGIMARTLLPLLLSHETVGVVIGENNVLYFTI
jgi:hypothetical protein